MSLFTVIKSEHGGGFRAGWLVAGAWSVASLAACATTTQVTSGWVDETRVGTQIDDVVVVAVSHNIVLRRQFEDSFVRQLQSAGLKAASSAAIVPEQGTPTRALLEPELKKRGTKDVLVTHLEGVEQESAYTPPTVYSASRGPRFRNYYGQVYNTVITPGYHESYKTYRLATRLYDVETGQLIWGIESKVLEPEDVNRATDEVVAGATADLRKHGLIK